MNMSGDLNEIDTFTGVTIGVDLFEDFCPINGVVSRVSDREYFGLSNVEESLADRLFLPFSSECCFFPVCICISMCSEGTK
jgi:hypothetical protein